MLLAALVVTLTVALAGPAAAVVSDATHQTQTESSINQWRAKNDKVRLSHSTCLNTYADRWAREIAKKKKLVHRSSSSLRAILKTCKMSGIGENLAMGDDSVMGTGAQVARAWMNSPGHKKNMLTTKFRYQAVGSVYVGGKWWTASLLANK